MDNAKSVAEKIKYYRNIKKMSQDELAEASGINVSTIKKYECSIRNPKPDQLQKIATALGISINAFISNDIESVNDILFLLMKLERQANLNINGNKDENGKYDANSITLTFSDSQINNLLAEYLELKDGKMGNDSADMPVDYDAVISDLVINIDRVK